MQETSQSIPTWAFQILQGLALFVGGGTIVKLITLYQNRRKPDAEVAESVARATAVNTTSAIRLMDRLDVALSETDRVRKERDDLKMTTDTQRIELQSYETQMRRMKSVMDLKGIHMSDYDEPKQ